MVKLFRNIRQKLLKEGKTFHYFKYAIGEIVLVVIGILIALQINNWNDERKERVLEKEYLMSLVTDLEEDIKKIEFANNGNTKLTNGLENLLALLANPLDTKNKQREVYLRSIKDTYWFLIVDFSENTISQLKNNNGFQLIKDKVISNAILHYQKGLNDSKHQNDELDLYYHALEERQKEIFNLSLGSKAMSFIDENYLNMLEPLASFEKLVSKGDYIVNDDPKLQSIYYGDVLFYRSTLKISMALNETQKQMAKDLIKLIEAKYKK